MRERWVSGGEGRDEADYQPDMPPLEAGEYLIGYLFEAGPTLAGGMGAGALTFGELRAWGELTGITLQPWEAQILRRLSIEYLNESHRAETPRAPPPWTSPSNKPEATKP